jgi:hypothetical protein
LGKEAQSKEEEESMTGLVVEGDIEPERDTVETSKTKRALRE